MVQGVSKAMNAQSNARGDAEERSTRSRASSFAISAAKSACACLRGSMEIRVSAPATMTGRPRTEGPSAHRFSTTTCQHCH
ncbi:hypothetical protein CKAN_02234300 [Cinnamomum micranthum f. kanehirae]|uniref:Uncharacterized protein n=1 Tax=Cinnamomum micranthum f. kanehirae TaxID=337451 RepID=A0A3S3NIZ3_9MAGN|nr:hypothetical protein CKAN_02234300 [Cinnamomum micranthum f. kanehirae]